MKIGWVDFSRSDRDKVKEVMNLLQEQGTVDEIGIGRIRDGFADLFFPGTSTVQTIAKYFLIVPYILKDASLGKYGTSLEIVLKEVDRQEKACGEQLMENCPEAEGIIGRRNLEENRWVTRPPSSIYWNGIRTYGICTRDCTIQELLRTALYCLEQRKASSSGRRRKDPEDVPDDRDAGLDRSANFFTVPDDYYGEWFSSLSVRLTPTEAAFLRTRMETSVGDSLLGWLLKNRVDVSKYRSGGIRDPFLLLYEEVRDRVPAEMAADMKLACQFNRMVYAARVRYNWILSEGRNGDAAAEWAEVESRVPYMMEADIDGIMSALDIRNPKLYLFLTDFRRAVLAGDLERADQILIQREISLKGRRRAKLCRRNEFPDDAWVGGRYLDYRLGNASQILMDIFEGEGISFAQTRQ